jgi:SAM-dependent methyltransferase
VTEVSDDARLSASTDDWDRHWSSYADSNALNPAQAYRRGLIFEALDLQGAPKPVRLLEIGSGQGEMSREVLSRYPKVELVGIDLSETGVRIAGQRVPGGTFIQRDLTMPMVIPEAYRSWASHAVCSEVLEHVDDPVAALRNARGYLAPGCRLVVTVPGGPMSAFDKHIGHRRHFTPTTLMQTLSAAGFLPLDARGAGFPFFNLYRLTVIARGRALIDDAAHGAGELPLAARAFMRMFSWLFRFNRADTLRGWQLVALAGEPLTTSGGKL